MATIFEMSDIIQLASDLVQHRPSLIPVIKMEAEKLVSGHTGELFAIFYGSSMVTNTIIEKPDESKLVYLLLKYLYSKITNEQITDQSEELFSLSNEQRLNLSSIFKILKQWLIDLIVVNSIVQSSEKIQDLKIYITELKKRLLNLKNSYIVPSGFSTVTFRDFDFSHCPLLEKYYVGPYSTASVVEFESTDFRRVVQIDPINPYQRSLRELTKDKVALGLEIENIPMTNLDIDFLFSFVSLRIIRGNNPYKLCHLYEAILPKIGGQGIIRNEKTFLIDIEEKGFFSLSWTLVKNVFYYLLKQSFDYKEAVSLYNRILCGFQYQLLLITFDNYRSAKVSTDLEFTRDHFILNEMCSKVAYDAVNTSAFDKRVIASNLQIVQTALENTNEKIYIDNRDNKRIKEIIFKHHNFRELLPQNLRQLQFIRGYIDSNIASTLQSTARKQFSHYTLSFSKNKNHLELVTLSNILEELTKEYGSNRVIQILHLIEYFVFSVAESSGLEKWYNDINSNESAACVLLRMARLYYNCSAIVFSKIYPDEKCSYEPFYYTKLVLILFSLFAMVEDLARCDKRLGSSLKDLRVSTKLCNVSLHQTLPQLVLPERKWFNLFKKVEVYFKSSETSSTNLFDFSSLIISEDADKYNVDVIYALSLLKKNFKNKHQKFETELRNVSAGKLQNLWYKLLYTDIYLPNLLFILRDISYLSRLSLLGFSINSIKTVISCFKKISEKVNRYENFTLTNNEYCTDIKLYTDEYSSDENLNSTDIYQENVTSETMSSSCKSNSVHKYKNYSYCKDPHIVDLRVNVRSEVDKMRSTDFRLSKDKNNYQRLILSQYTQQDKAIENMIISTQNQKPDNLTKSQYYRLASIQSYDSLEYMLLYIALKNEDISFEIEEHCYLVKQTIFKIKTSGANCLLEKQLQNEKLARGLVEEFTRIALDLKERITQYKSMGHVMDILLFLHNFLSDTLKPLIDDCLLKVRTALLTFINENRNTIVSKGEYNLISVTCCYVILTYKNTEKLNEANVRQIVKLRILIDQKAKLCNYVPRDLYIKTMITIFDMSLEIDRIISKDSKLELLDDFLQHSRGLWRKDKNMNYFVKDCYQFMPLKGRIYKNGQPLSCLPNKVVNNPVYKECFEQRNFLAETDEETLFGQKLRFYEVKSVESTKIRFYLLANNQIWIKVNEETFVSKHYLGSLPKCLLEDCAHSDQEKTIFYTHWYYKDKIFIKNVNKEVKFEIDLNNHEIYSTEHKKYVVPFTKDGFEKSNIIYTTFSRFEDESYILTLKKEPQDSEPNIIFLLRLNLTFKFSFGEIISQDIKDFRLSKDQQIKTLFGLSQYLVLEQNMKDNNPIKLNKKLIIPHHPIEKGAVFYSNNVKFNLAKVNKPAYFSYEIDENLKCLNSETTAGSLYLALLYFKTAILDKDLLFEMNGFEICSEILKTCWQNCEYSETEFNIILDFFYHDYPAFGEPWGDNCIAEQRGNERSCESEVYHRNIHAIIVRLLYLLCSSHQTDFLIKAHNQRNNIYCNLLEKGFLQYHFNFYLIFKHKIHERCKLSVDEEKELLFFCTKYHSNSLLSTYYNCLNKQKKLEMKSKSPLDYKRLEHSMFSKTSFHECKFVEIVENYFNQSSKWHAFYNKSFPIANLFSTWIEIQFEVKLFAFFYGIAFKIGNNDDFNRRSFSNLLSYLFLESSSNERKLLYDRLHNYQSEAFIKMLYIVSIVPEQFKSLPSFILLKTGKIDSDQAFHLNKESRKLNEADILSSIENDKSLDDIRSSVWSLLQKKYLDKEQYPEFCVENLIKDEVKQNLEHDFENLLKRKNAPNICKSLPSDLYKTILMKRKNKELYDFFIDVAKQCEKIVLSQEIGYNVINTSGLSDWKIDVPIDDIQKHTDQSCSYLTTNQNHSQNLEWKVENIDINEHYKKLQQMFEVKYSYPEQLPFPLDPSYLPENCPAREVFSRGYGEVFISDIKKSYGRPSSIVKISGKYFIFLAKETSKSSHLLTYLEFNYDQELSNLGEGLREIQKDLCPYIERWLEDKASQKYISETIRIEIQDRKNALNDTINEINNRLIEKKYLVEPIPLESTKEVLKRLQNENAWKKDAKRWLRDIEDGEDAVSDFILENNSLFELHVKYCLEQNVMNTVLIKFICKEKKIHLSTYEKLDKEPFEIKLMENYSYQSDEYVKKFEFLLDDGMFCEIKTEEITDSKMLQDIEKNPTAVGYLQTRKTDIHLKAEYNIDDVERALIDYYVRYENINQNLFKEICQNLSVNIDRSDDSIMFILHLIIGKNIFPTKKDILCLVKDIDELEKLNPFILHHKDILHQKITCYLLQQALIQKLTRIMLLIDKYKLLHAVNDKDERDRVLETIMINILTSRCYDEKVYLSWLLFEVENNILIRSTQYSLVEALKNEEFSSVYQLNMGEGKTSVILIILSEIVADGEQIVRINCLEPLMGVMQELLRNKFGGLLRKKIYVMPFSREVNFSTENLKRIEDMLQECRKYKHILLVTPEQRLCFQLKKQEMFLEYLQSKDANDYFNWSEYNDRGNKYTLKNNVIVDIKKPYVLTEPQVILKQVLQSLKYIDSTDKIIKYPSDGYNKFYTEVLSGITDSRCSYNLLDAFNILREKSVELKTQREQHLKLLYSIDELKFFDILDESDEILRHGKELNYTLGSPKPLDGGQIRWEIPFVLFKIIFCDKPFSSTLKNASKRADCPVIFDENFRPLTGIEGGIPLVRFISRKYFDDDIKPELSRELCKILRSKFDEKQIDIIDEEGNNYGSYEDFIQGKCFDKFKENKIVELLKTNSRDILNSFLLAKAWLSHELLYHIMSFRYRVEYGLNQKKEKRVAIPFRGKDLPSENSEFSHPDIMIGFTIISYLYRGLEREEVKSALIKLRSDPKQNKDTLLQNWVEENRNWIEKQNRKENENFPEWLRSFRTLDLEDTNKIEKVHLYLSRNFGLIQYYLSNFVFPNDTKHYEEKLTGNAHTLAGEGRTNGFSGTDDRNDTMPESIIPKRLSSQEGTNGKMLHILSRKVNSQYQTVEISSSISFLNQVCQYAIKHQDCYILIDAGAMITEMSNLDVSKYFIRNIDCRFEGVVYFSDKTNRIMVILKSEECLPLSSCHIDSRKLFVYLDEAHTRGTDLKLPLTALGIVTLGKQMNKDKLMQAVMRLRDLDYKQSIILWGSIEISAEITIVNGIEIDQITNKHVLAWVTYNTIRKNESDLYPVMKDKLRYVIKSRALQYQKKLKDIPMNSLMIAYRTETPDCIEEAYKKTPREQNPIDLLNRDIGSYIAEFYPDLKKELSAKANVSDLTKQIDFDENEVDRPQMEKMLSQIRSKLPKVVFTVNADLKADQENEQEIEEMKNVEVPAIKLMTAKLETAWDFNKVFKPNFLQNADHSKQGYPKLKRLNEYFQSTDISGLKKLRWHDNIRVTENFIHTIDGIHLDGKNKQYQNDYLKPVNVVLIHKKGTETYFIIVSMFEAQYITILIHKEQDSKVMLIHIDDTKRYTIIPTNAIGISQEDYKILLLIRLFNGECRYENTEIQDIKKYIAYVGSYNFDKKKEISERIYGELRFKHYLSNHFMTYKLAAKLAKENEKIVIDFEKELPQELDLQKYFRSIVDQSIAADAKDVWEIPWLIKELVRIRGKSEQYHRSSLKEILDNTSD